MNYKGSENCLVQRQKKVNNLDQKHVKDFSKKFKNTFQMCKNMSHHKTVQQKLVNICKKLIKPKDMFLGTFRHPKNISFFFFFFLLYFYQKLTKNNSY